MQTHLRFVILFGFLAGCLGTTLLLTPFGRALENEIGLGWMFAARGERAAPAEALVVGIDGKSVIFLDDVRTISELSRVRHAQLIRMLMERNAAAIVFDVYFGSSRLVQDGRLIGQLQDSDRVVLFQRWARPDLKRDDSPDIQIDQLASPYYYFADAATGLAPFMLPQETVEIAARTNLYANFGTLDRDIPTLPVTALALHTFTTLGDGATRLAASAFATNGPASGAQYGDEIANPADPAQRGGARSDRPYGDGDGHGAFADFAEQLAVFRERAIGEPAMVDAAIGRLRTVVAGSERGMRNADRVEALLRAYAAPHNALVNYYGGSETLDRVPLFLALKDDALPDDLTGRVVFVGAADVDWDHTRVNDRSPGPRIIGLPNPPPPPDQHFTVFGAMSGVEIAATAFLNLLHGDTLRRLNTPIAAALVFVVGLLAGAIGLLVPGVRAILAMLALGAVTLGGAYYSFAHYNLWPPITVPVLLQLPLALLIGLSAQFVAARRRERNVSEAMSYYVPAEVVRRAEAEGRAPAQIEERYAICLSTDIEGYTTLSETVPPLALAAAMGKYWGLVNQIVEDTHHGRTIDIVADSAMCVWAVDDGHPVRGATDLTGARTNACHAAIDLARAIDGFNQEQRRKANGDGLALPTRFGLHAGRTALGSIGGGHHFDYGVLGDVPNTASRVEGLNKILGSRILATRSVTDDLNDILTRPVGAFQFKNKTTPLEIVEIVGARSANGDALAARCNQFSDALAAYWAHDLAAASAGFGALLDDSPHDGPARFWFSRCHAPPPPDGEDYIRLDIK